MHRSNMRKRFLPFLVVFVALTAIMMTVAFAEGEAEYVSNFYASPLSLLPPVIAIILALITKEVYSSLFVGILVGGLLYANFNPELTIMTMFFNEDGGMIYKISDSWNAGILVFLVILGIMVALMNKAGGSTAFGNWAKSHIKTRVGGQLSTMLLGVLIFVDDYFNCLTVGSVMLPVTDGHRVSRAKLAYLIDATAAPICIIAPISSWAAAVTGSVPEDSGINGFAMFLQTIPNNLYALLTIVMCLTLAIGKFDYGPMKIHEDNARDRNDLFTTPDRPYGEGLGDVKPNANGKVIDLVLPVVVLIFCCIMGMVYTGGFFDGESFIDAFAGSDASMGLVLGSVITLIFTFIYYMIRRVMTFQEFTECIPDGFKQMVPAILILTFAWTLSGMTGLLGGATFVENLVANAAPGMKAMLPAIVFLVCVGLAFATGTSWGTFGIMIPIVLPLFPLGSDMMVTSIAACLAGAVCGDHCSPITETTIMASAGARCNHVNHVATQLPYALTVAAVCFVGYIIAGLTNGNTWVTLIISLVLLEVVLFALKSISSKKDEAAVVK